jgi:hypothetical protein
MTDFFDTYFEYAGIDHSEAPVIFHRWAAISMLGALLGRQCFIPFGHSVIYPNQYIMIMGSPGTRKSSAINIATKLLRSTGYTRFSSDKTSKERFLMDMVQIDEALSIEQLMDMDIETPAETYIAIGEFTDFIGQNNMEFVTMLTNLWDCPAKYKNPKIHGKSVEVYQPTVNILGGNTAQGFSLAFPPEAMGNGFISRLLFIYGEPTGRKITFPSPPDPLIEATISLKLKEIKEKVVGSFTFTSESYTLLDRIYREDIGIDDHRFKHYATRRFPHLLKMCALIAATRISTLIIPDDILKANTMLIAAEKKMPKALGEFGKSKYSDTANTLLDILHAAREPVTANDLFKKVSQDLNKMTELHDILKSLMDADKIQVVNIMGKSGYVIKAKPIVEWHTDLYLQDYLTNYEKV